MKRILVKPAPIALIGRSHDEAGSAKMYDCRDESYQGGLGTGDGAVGVKANRR